MIRLVDRNRQIPGGLKFLEPATKWQPVPWSSFSTIVDGLVNHRRANAYMAAKNKWNLERRAVEDEVDEYNAKICQEHGWTNFIVDHGGGGLDLKSRSPHSPVSVAVAGVKLLTEWLGEGGKPVAKEESERRALICSDCPQNQKGDWTRWFTKPASELIRKQLSMRNEMALTTSTDESLGVCNACGCPLKLKVHCPMVHIEHHMSAEVEKSLDPRCWILHRNDPVPAS